MVPVYRLRQIFALGAAVATSAGVPLQAQAPAKAPARAAAALNIPVEFYKLDNGLRVVLSPDSTTPTAVVAVYYNIGFRTEPRDRTGFAHLFEHLMFQGSRNLGKLQFVKLVEQNGGILNGSTRFDFTNY
ncbi:MAG TPA: insulinase family protein, partial [Gemmatimonadaceae bacterium]|nr:insulinase family protein [Gemmatimonadaceae bacterium]